MIRRRQKTRRNISPRGALAGHRPPRFAPALERLETRDLLAGNLRLDALRFVDANNHPLDRPMVGEQVHLRADWTATDVPLTSSFRATLTDTTSGITSLTLNSTTYSGGGNGVFQFSTLFEGWYASAGQHHIEVLLDSASAVAETNESDNKLTLNYEAAAPSGLPSKLLQPLAGQQNVDWSVVRYSDLDPRVDDGVNPPEYHDYACDDGLLPARFKCGPFTTDQFQGLELQLPNFASMDDGHTVYAVADGVVTRRLDGFVIEGVDAGDAAGTTVSVLGDVNGDGRNDLLIAAPGGDSDTDPDVPEDNVGEVYVVYGQPGGFPAGFELADLLPANQGDGSRGFVLRGIATDDAMGSPAVAVGDFNGDGRADFAIGAPAADTGGTVAGEVYVILGQASNFPPLVQVADLLAANGGDGTRGLVLQGATSTDRFGAAIANAGDLNGDGIDDLAIGAPQADGVFPAFFAGRTYVIYGQTTALPAEFNADDLLPNGANGLAGFFIDGETFFDRAGTAVVGLGDVNGDGADDLGIGAPLAGTSSRGAAYVVFGHTDVQEAATPFPPVLSLADLREANGGDGTTGFVLDGFDNNGQAGSSLSALGDINADGLVDFGVGVPGGTGVVTRAGASFILYGSTTVPPAERQLDFLLPSRGGAGAEGFALLGGATGDLAGTALVRAGDINSDGLVDLAVGAPGVRVSGTQLGGVYVVFASATGWETTVDLSLLGKEGGGPGFLLTGPAAGSGIGGSLAAPGNLNQIGGDDLLIGAPSAGTGGRVYGVNGRAQPFRSELSLDLVTADDMVEIDHGQGWVSIYQQLDPDSIAVRPGDVVSIGASLGLVGSRTAGSAQLRFALEHRESPVETYLDPSAYWLKPLAYQGQTDQSVLDAGVTNLDPTDDLAERPSDIARLHPSYAGNVWFWYRLSHLNPNDEYQVIWVRPNGTVIREAYHCLLPKLSPIFYPFCESLDASPNHFGLFAESLQQPWKDYAGRWQVMLVVNDEVRVQQFFDVVSSPIEPEIRMEFGPDPVGNPVLLSGRSTPVDLGTAVLNGTASPQDFVIENHGSTALHLTDLIVPDGFRLTTPFPSIVNVDTRVRFSLELDTSTPGLKLGELSFRTDDTDESRFHFVVAGEVLGSFPAGSPQLDLTGPAAAYQWLESPQLLAASARLTDPDSFTFDQGRLEARVIVGNTAEDRLGVRNLGTSGGEIGIAGNSVTYSGVPIGVFSGGQGTAPLVVQFNDQATIPAVEALLHNLTYANTAADPGGASKYVRLQLTDDTGKTSNVATQQVLLSPSNLNQLPEIATLFTQPDQIIQPAEITLTASGVVDPDGFVSLVKFYVETNNLAGLQVGPGGDQLVGADSAGSDGWSATFSSSLLTPGLKTGYAVAVDDLLAESNPAVANFQVLAPNLPPAIVFLGIDPAVVVPPQFTTLTANGVSDVDGFVTRVDFFRESNGIAGLQTGVGGDQFVGADGSSAGGWSLIYSTNGLTEGLHVFYARALDNGGVSSAPVAATLQVGLPPPVGSVFYLSDLLPPTGNGLSGFVLRGDQLGDQSGYTVSGAGDFNHDGFDDLLIGAPLADGGSPARVDSGISYLVFGSVAGFDPLLDLNTLDGTSGFKILGALAGDRAGYVSSAGDVNGDGFGDLLIGAPGFDVPGAPDAGSAYVIFGSPLGPGPTLDLAAINGINGFRLDGVGGDDLTGLTLSGAGDFNGDGLADLLIGARAADPGNPSRPDAGSVYLTYGRQSGFGSVIDLGSLSSSQGFRAEGLGPVDLLGQSVHWAGDVNGDGLGDIIIGAQMGTPGTGTARGAAFVVFGDRNPIPSPLLLDQLNGINGFRVNGVNQDDLLGFSVSGAGDFNSDGFADILIGVPSADPGVTPRLNAGSAYLIFGSSSPFASVFDLLTLGGANGFRIDGIREGDALGIAVGAAGDVNGDGFDDVLLGAYHASVGTPPRAEAGETYVLFGTASSASGVLELSSLNGQNGFRLEGVAPQDQSGWWVAGIGDLNGDGFDDLAIGAPNNGPGSTYVFFGRDFTGAVTQEGTSTFDTLTGSVLADVFNGKQSLDTLVGAGGADVLLGGEGHDVLGVSDSLFRRVAGGRGIDTLRIDGAGLVVDLTQIADSRLSGIERIDLTGSGANTLILNLQEVLNLSPDSNQLIVTRNAGDSVQLGDGWVVTSLLDLGGTPFYEFRQGTAQLLVQAVEEGTPWRNPANELDVDNSGGTNPVGSRDVLLIINLLNSNLLGNNPLPNPPTADFAPPPLGAEYYYDVNGDGFATPFDALLVVNFLNNRPGGEGERTAAALDAGEGEALVSPLSASVLGWGTSTALVSAGETDSATGVDEVVSSAASPWSAVAVVADSPATACDATWPTAEESLDQLLSDFASEVADRWHSV
ncbi:MAG: dockerin type I domain-containing protein [Pirellulales bacterium]